MREFLMDAQAQGDNAKVVIKAMLNPEVIKRLTHIKPVGNNVADYVSGINKWWRSLSSANSNGKSELIEDGQLGKFQDINNKIQQLPNLRTMFIVIAREMRDAHSDVLDLVDASVDLVFFVVTDWLVRGDQLMT